MRLDAANETLAVVKQVTYLIKNSVYRWTVERQQNYIFQSHSHQKIMHSCQKLEKLEFEDEIHLM